MGKVEIDHTGSGSGITLSSDGTSLLLDGTAIGGGGGGYPDLYRDNAVNATTPVASGGNAVAIGRGSSSSGLLSISFGFSANSSAQCATAIGASSGLQGANASANGAVALGGANSRGTDSVAIGIATNNSSYGASGSNSIAMGYQAKATGNSSVCLSQQSTASGSSSCVIGGYSNVADATYSFATGQYADTNGIFGKMSRATGRFAATGDAQSGTFVLRSDTTDATAEPMTTANTPTSSLNITQIVIPSNAAFAFHGTIVAKQSGSANAAAWKVEGLIVNNGGTTTLTNSATTVLSYTPSWGMALSADDTNDALKIQVTGAASTNIRWVATIHTSEVTYA
jgi:trimeric autotransporter adhesin